MSALFLLLLIVAVLVPRVLPRWLRWTVLILIGIPVVLFIAFIAVTAHISHSIDFSPQHVAEMPDGRAKIVTANGGVVTPSTNSNADDDFIGTRCTARWQPECCVMRQSGATKYLTDTCGISRLSQREGAVLVNGKVVSIKGRTIVSVNGHMYELSKLFPN
jgi:hypothetical protein